MNGAADALVRTASANVARHGGVDIRVGGFRVSGKQGCGRHQLSGLAVTALRHLFRDPRSLQGMTRGFRQAFDCRYFPASDARHGNAARSGRRTVEMNRARSALLQTTTEFCARQANRISQHPKQRRIGADVDVVFLAING